MIILFHSNECSFCIKLLEYINNNNLNDFFKFINIDTITVIPENITIVPTIIDPSIEAPLEGKKAFEYVVNHKYFNHPTNNINFWVKTPPPKPTIEEDKKALDKSALTIYTNLDDNISTKYDNTNKYDNTTNKHDNTTNKHVYYKPITKTSNDKTSSIVARINNTNQNNDLQINDKQKIINNNLKKNMALMRLKR